MLIEYLSWDSEFFGLKIGKVEINDQVKFDTEVFRKAAVSENYDLVYIFKHDSMLIQSKLNKANIYFMDILVYMSMMFDPLKYASHNFEIRNELNEEELTECYNIAEQISFVSRFGNELLIGIEKTKKLYRNWIDNALKGTYADGVIIAKNNNEVVGVHVIKTDNDTAYCSIIGVNNKNKQQGIGSNLWQQAFSYWATKGIVNKCVVPFSLQNIESLNFHLKMGFDKVETVKYIYHYRKKI